jgi:hypothetical protein
MSAGTILIGIESHFNPAALRIMRIARIYGFATTGGINVLPAELFATFPTPTSAAAGAYDKTTHTGLQSARENVVARSVFQAPALAPRALFSIFRTTHLQMLHNKFFQRFNMHLENIQVVQPVVVLIFSAHMVNRFQKAINAFLVSHNTVCLPLFFSKHNPP